ncbi:hypothetical protein AZH53_04600 [Methanomicrobiaceae archaeon CYW5]|uniref:DUF373 family protein n=1 Tax=Methanovulcanius yangii TaxID=1789227 RepID=UPI0029CA5FE9|nr:DUF373 family protein [Methanovulcanius yangii]MBT8507697.1 hypothetical protein [Methanovulcanius yangii]
MSSERTLILCVDRDDDIGFKAGVQSPVVGREACLDTANRLGLVDPEDSDVNAIFQAIKTYDALKARGEDVCIAVLAGNHYDLINGDRKIAEELRKVVWDLEAGECILVTDGAEDEYILPVIQSKISVASVQRVIVKQMPNLEGTYYIIKKILEDPKYARSILIPIGLAMLLYAIGSLLGNPQLAIFIVVGVLGIYLLFKGLGLDEYLNYTFRALQESFVGGRFSFFCYIGAIFLSILGIIMGLASFLEWYTPDAGIFFQISSFIFGAIGYLTFAVIVAFTGKIIDVSQNDPHILARIVVIPFYLTALAVIAYGASVYVISLGGTYDFPIAGLDGVRILMLTTGIALVIAFLGMYVQKAIGKMEKYAIQPKSEKKKGLRTKG